MRALRNGWVHYMGYRGECPVCGKPAHVGMSERGGRIAWLHDDFEGLPEFYETHLRNKDLQISIEQFRTIAENARAAGIDPDRRTWKNFNSKRVRCVETGSTFGSIAEAAKSVGVARASLSTAIKRCGTSGGFHWELVD